jgi:hypothetical protein
VVTGQAVVLDVAGREYVALAQHLASSQQGSPIAVVLS